MSGARLRFAPLIHFGLLSTLFLPFFFLIFRLMAFNTVPRDDYAAYLLWLLNEPGGIFPGSPYGYRVLSVLAAAPFYYMLPALPLTNMPAGLDPAYLKATASLAAVSYLAMIAAAVMAHRLVVVRHGRPPLEGLLASVFLLTCELYMSFYGVDPLAILITVCALYALDRVWMFAVLTALSVFTNEKILIVLGTWLAIRCLVDRRERAFLLRRLVVIAAAIAGYVALLLIARLKGHSEQFDAGAYLPTVLQNLVATVTTPRGILLNMLPCALLLGAVLWSWRTLGRTRCGIYTPADLFVVPGLIVLALALTQFYQVGRIVAHAAPLFIVPIALGFGKWLNLRAVDAPPTS